MTATDKSQLTTIIAEVEYAQLSGIVRQQLAVKKELVASKLRREANSLTYAIWVSEILRRVSRKRSLYCEVRKTIELVMMIICTFQ